MKGIQELCKSIVKNLVQFNFDELEKCHALGRVSSDDIIRVIKEYGGTLTDIPDEEYQTDTIEIYKYRDNSGCKVDIDLWFDGKRSDLTLQLDIKTNAGGEVQSFIISDILVM